MGSAKSVAPCLFADVREPWEAPEGQSLLEGELKAESKYPPGTPEHPGRPNAAFQKLPQQEESL